MAKQYDNNNSGVLFRNDKGGNEKAPDYKGSAEVDRVEYWISAWVKEGKNGKFLSIAFQPKEQRPSGGSSAPPADDDLPF